MDGRGRRDPKHCGRVSERFDHRLDESDRERQDDRVSVTPDSCGALWSHSGGKPINQRLNSGASWPPAPVLVPRRRPAVNPLNGVGPISADGSSPAGIVSDPDPVSRLKTEVSVGTVPGNDSCSSYHPVFGGTVAGASGANGLSSTNRSGVPSASWKANRFELRPSM